MKKNYILVAAVAVIIVLLGLVANGYFSEKVLNKKVLACETANKQAICNCPNNKVGDSQTASSTRTYYNEKYRYSINYFSDLDVVDVSQEMVSFADSANDPGSIAVSVNPGSSMEKYLKNPGTKIEKKTIINGNEMTIVSHTGDGKNESERFALIEKNNTLFIIVVAYPEISDQIFDSFKFTDFLQQ
jgi:hypothetical protein